MNKIICVLIFIVVSTQHQAWGQSPGDSIGTTAWDFQIAGSFGQRIMVDDLNQVHINWTKMSLDQGTRFCAWNGRWADGSYYGETPASPSYGGYAQLDVIRDPDPANQKTIIAYYYHLGRPYSWIDIDAGNLLGAWPQAPKNTGFSLYIMPYIAVASNNNIIMATFLLQCEDLRLLLTTDFGESWTTITDIDSCPHFSQFVRASRNPGSHKVVCVWTQIITDTLASDELDLDVWYMLSSDDGATWTQPANITNYQPYPIDSARAYNHVNAIFDRNDNLHIAWGGRRITGNDYHVASKIFHWDEINDSITVVNSPSTYYNEPGGWWVKQPGMGYFEMFRMPADQPQMIVDNSTGWLYCLWHGNDDPDDYAASGYYNGEIYGSLSTDNGLSWADYTNLTNTRSPGAGIGECLSEDALSVCPYVVNDSIYVTYIEDKDAGYVWRSGGRGITENPVRCWVFHKDLITGLEEENKIPIGEDNFSATILRGPLVLPKDKTCKVFDITGRVVAPDKIKPGIYFIEIDGVVRQKVVKIR